MTSSSLILLLAFGVLAIAFIIRRIRRRKTVLSRCKACDREISRKAKTCPHCGHSKKRRLRVILIIMAILFLVFHEEIHQTFNLPDPVDFLLHDVLGIDR